MKAPDSSLANPAASDGQRGRHPADGHDLGGVFHINRVEGTEAGPVVVRLKRPHPPRNEGPQIERAPWNEADTLAALRPHLSFIPQLTSVHRNSRGEQVINYSFIPGEHPRAGTPELAQEMGRAIARLGSIPADVLPADPRATSDSRDDATMVIEQAETVWRHRRSAYRALYETSGTPDDPLAHVRDRVDGLMLRPLGPLHNDLHHLNILELEPAVAARLGSKVALLDLELAGLGDPLSDIAGHLEKMAAGPAVYSAAAERALARTWVSEIGEERSRGHETDLHLWRDIHAARWAIGAVSNAGEIVRQARNTENFGSVLLTQAERIVGKISRLSTAWGVAPPHTTQVAADLQRFAWSEPG